MPTSVEAVAKSAGVSVSGVFRRLRSVTDVSTATRKRVHKAADEPGFSAVSGRPAACGRPDRPARLVIPEATAPPRALHRTYRP